MSIDAHRSNIQRSKSRQNGFGTWAVVAVLTVLFWSTGILAYLGRTCTDTRVPTSGYVGMALRVIFSVGAGLMTLDFYSSREGYDEPPIFRQEPPGHRDEV